MPERSALRFVPYSFSSPSRYVIPAAAQSARRRHGARQIAAAGQRGGLPGLQRFGCHGPLGRLPHRLALGAPLRAGALSLVARKAGAVTLSRIPVRV